MTLLYEKPESNTATNKDWLERTKNMSISSFVDFEFILTTVETDELPEDEIKSIESDHK